MKKRWIFAAIAYAVLAGIPLPPLAKDLDCFFSRRISELTYHPMDGWSAVLHGGKPLQFYLLLAGLLAVLMLAVLLAGNYLDYQSGTVRVTPDITTPAPAGQGQFGTAKWLPEAKISGSFSVWNVPKSDPALRDLIAAGKKDREEIRNAEIQID